MTKRITAAVLTALLITNITMIGVALNPPLTAYAEPDGEFDLSEIEIRAMMSIAEQYQKLGALEEYIEKSDLTATELARAKAMKIEMEANLAASGYTAQQAGRFVGAAATAGVVIPMVGMMYWDVYVRDGPVELPEGALNIPGPVDFVVNQAKIQTAISQYYTNLGVPEVANGEIWSRATNDIFNAGVSGIGLQGMIDVWKDIFGTSGANQGVQTLSSIDGVGFLSLSGFSVYEVINQSNYTATLYRKPVSIDFNDPGSGNYLYNTYNGGTGIIGYKNVYSSNQKIRDGVTATAFSFGYGTQVWVYSNTVYLRAFFSQNVPDKYRVRVEYYQLSNGVPTGYETLLPIEVFGLPSQTINNQIPAAEDYIDRHMNREDYSGVVSVNLPVVEDTGQSDAQKLHQFMEELNNMTVDEMYPGVTEPETPPQSICPDSVIGLIDHMLGMLEMSLGVHAYIDTLFSQLQQLREIYLGMPITGADTAITTGVLQGVDDWIHQEVAGQTRVGANNPTLPRTWTPPFTLPLPWPQTIPQTIARAVPDEIARLAEGNPAIPIPPPTGGINLDPLKSMPLLREVFPFCIPFDFVDIIKLFNAVPEAPVIEVNFPSSVFVGGGSFDFDLSRFDQIAVMFRWLITILFIVGLMMLSSKVIKW